MRNKWYGAASICGNETVNIPVPILLVVEDIFMVMVEWIVKLGFQVN